MATQHIIELNGKRYDAVTGRIIVADGSTPARPKPHYSSPHKSMDGFSGTSKKANPAPTHKPDKSNTLMRTTVSKPAKPKPAATHNPAILSFASTSATTLSRAKAVPKSMMVRRFSDLTPGTGSRHGATRPKSTTSGNRIQAISSAQTVSVDPLAAAIANADSHAQPKPKRERRHIRVARRLKISPRLVSIGSLVLAGLLIGGFFAYQNMANLSMHLAAARAGVAGSLPGYRPAGFKLNGGISYKSGEIVVGYKANADDRTFKITQARSSWNSETLLDNYLVANRRDYQKVEDKGKTIYLYDGSNATWVDGGVWYRIEGNSQLNSDQLLSLANSL